MIPCVSTPAMCLLKDLKDGTYDLADVALMVDALMMRADNEEIADEIRKRKAAAR